MKNDELLSALADTARDEAALLDDPRWDALTAGTLSEADQAELRALAERSPAARTIYEAFRPLGEDALDRATDRVHGSLAGGRARPPMRRRAIAAVAIVALAAAASFALMRGAPSPVPVYELAVAGGDRELRADPEAPGEPIVLGPRAHVEVMLRPVTRATGSVAARAALFRGGAATAWAPRADVSGDGVVRIAIDRRDLPADLPPGPAEIVFAVGRPEVLPDGAEALFRAAARGDAGGALRFLRLRVIVGDAAGARP